MFILNHQESDGAILIFFSFHNQLKTVQLNGKVNRRVDFLLHQLLNKTLGRALDPRANGTWLSKLTE